MVTTLREIETIYQSVKVGKQVLDKISVWRGDITKLEIDVVVNAANSGLRGGGGVDGAIHTAAGYRELQEECRKIGRCDVGDTVATSACKMTHVKKIFHTVGPQVYGDLPSKEERDELIRCYASALELAVEHGLTTIAFPCISTGIYGYPNDLAARSVINYLYKTFMHSKIRNKIDRVVLCLFLEKDVKCYGQEIGRVVKHFQELENPEAEISSPDDSLQSGPAETEALTESQEAEVEDSTPISKAETENDENDVGEEKNKEEDCNVATINEDHIKENSPAPVDAENEKSPAPVDAENEKSPTKL